MQKTIEQPQPTLPFQQADGDLLEDIDELLQLADGCTYLDVGCGEGSYTGALQSRAGEWTAIDPQAAAVQTGKQRYPEIHWHQGDLSRPLPFADEIFDGSLCILGLHQPEGPFDLFREVARTLRPGGSFVMLTATPDQLRNCWLNRYFPGTMADSVRHMPDLADISTGLSAAGMRLTTTRPVRITGRSEDHRLYSSEPPGAGELPESLPHVFASLPGQIDHSEWASGLEQLRADIRSGHFSSRKDGPVPGDYLLLRATKYTTVH